MSNFQNYPVIDIPFLYKYGLRLQNSTISPQTKLSLLAGVCRDANDIVDIRFGDLNPGLEGNITSAPLRIDNTINGPGGLAYGELVTANTMYAIYIIADSRNYFPISAMATNGINVYLTPGPFMPTGYDSWRFIGYWSTDSSSHWATGYYYGLGSDLTFIYDTPQATPISAGTSNTYSYVNLLGLVPLVANSLVSIYSVFNPGAAGDTLTFASGNSTSSMGQVIITGQVNNINVTTTSLVLAQNVTINSTPSPAIQYKVSGTDTTAVYVAGFSVSGSSYAPI